MTESITDAFKCNQYGTVYDSEKELSEHQQAAHDAVSGERKVQETRRKSLQTKRLRQKAKTPRGRALIL